MNVLSKLPLEIKRIYKPKEKYTEHKYCALVLKFSMWVWVAILILLFKHSESKQLNKWMADSGGPVPHCWSKGNANKQEGRLCADIPKAIH